MVDNALSDPLRCVVRQAALAAQVKLRPLKSPRLISARWRALVSQLAWSPDGNELYLQTLTEDKKALPKDIYHYVMPLRAARSKKWRAAGLGRWVLDVEVGTNGAG